MKKIITKELLRKVLPKETENFSEGFSFYIDEDYIVFRDEGENLFNYNIYKFAFKCKEWALSKGYGIYSSCKSSSISQDGILLWISSGENNEIKTIIKACVFILTKKESK